LKHLPLDKTAVEAVNLHHGRKDDCGEQIKIVSFEKVTAGCSKNIKAGLKAFVALRRNIPGSE
jgi:hypothetical protein